MPYQPIDEQLSEADVLIQNAQADPDLLSAFADVGQDEAYFEDGQARLDEARRLHQKQQREYGEQHAATDALHEKRDTVDETYIRHLKLARLAFREDTAAQEALQLSGERRRTLPGWIDQAQSFYDNLLAGDGWKQAMAGYGVTEEELTEAQSAVEDVTRARQKQHREAGEAQQTTETRDAALDRLAAWMSEAKALARITLDDRRQKLEELGIVAPS